jgi:hypothetical protein
MRLREAHGSLRAPLRGVVGSDGRSAHAWGNDWYGERDEQLQQRLRERARLPVRRERRASVQRLADRRHFRLVAEPARATVGRFTS